MGASNTGPKKGPTPGITPLTEDEQNAWQLLLNSLQDERYFIK